MTIQLEQTLIKLSIALLVFGLLACAPAEMSTPDTGGDNSGLAVDEPTPEEPGGEEPSGPQEEPGLSPAECLAERISNGGFETTDERIGLRNGRQLNQLALDTHPNRSWDHFNSIPSWEPTAGHVIEVQANRTATAFEGVHYLEADAETEFQTTIQTCAGQHRLQFAYYPRSLNPSANTIEVSIDGSIVGTVGGYTSGQFWRVIRLNANLTAGSHTIKFVAQGNSAGATIGSLVDAVSLKRSQNPGVITALMTFTSTYEGPILASASRLAPIVQALAAYATPVTNPKILIIQDGAHYSEQVADFDLIEDSLAATGNVTTLDLAVGIYAESELQKYDLIWYVNPGYPASRADILTDLEDVSAGVVLSGDDLGRAWNESHSDVGISTLSGATFVDNGTQACPGGPGIDNNSGQRYQFSGVLVDGLSNGDDVDHVTIASDNIEVFATANVNYPACGGEVEYPLIFGYRN